MNWKRNIESSRPPENERVLVSDGEIISIASYIVENNNITWLFEKSSFKDIKIFWWMNLPELPPKINKESNI